MKKNKRSGFTVVELVIVIAVIAVLAAVLIPTFASLIRQANQSVDQQLVNNLNKILMAEEAVEGKNPYMHAAVLDLAENGYQLSALKMTEEENILIWDQRIDRFVIGKMESTVLNGYTYYSIVYAYSSKSDEDKYKNADGDYTLFPDYSQKNTKILWIICDDDDLKTAWYKEDFSGCSLYWAQDDAPTFSDTYLDAKSGLDLGYCTETVQGNIKVATTDKKATFYGNFKCLMIEGKEVYHYAGKIEKLVLNCSAGGSYYEYGEVTEIDKGTLNVFTLHAMKGSKFAQTKAAITQVLSKNNSTSTLIDNGATFGN